MKTVLAAALLCVSTLTASAQVAPPPEALKDLAPSGKLKAAINFGNAVLAQRGPGGEPRGVTADLSRELAKRLGVPAEFVIFDAAGKVFEAAKTGAWDIAFVAIEPERAELIEFTAPYVLIEGTYMVPADSALKIVEEVDREGVRIAVGLNSAYDLYLTRTIKNATIVRAKVGGGKAMIELFVNDKLEVAAGVRQQLEAYAKGRTDVRIMGGRFGRLTTVAFHPHRPTKGRAVLQAASPL